METIRLGRTELQVTKTAFGALPVQRRTLTEGATILRRAYEGGINFFDTARAYSDSEEKLGLAFTPAMREKIVIATKSGAGDGTRLRQDLETSLRLMKTDYIDIYQLHNPAVVPRPGGADGRYDELLAMKTEGKIRHISLTNHRRPVAIEAVESGLYDTLQFPFSLLAGPEDYELVELCKKHDVGFIAMKALSGGLITNARTAFAFMQQYDNVVPIWGVQHMHELEEFLTLAAEPPVLDDDMRAAIAADKEALFGDFCRGCGYCMPCPAGIDLSTAARVYFLVTRSPYKRLISKESQANLHKVEDCIHCGACKTRCPYGLDTEVLARKQYDLYREFIAAHADEVE